MPAWRAGLLRTHIIWHLVCIIEAYNDQPAHKDHGASDAYRGCPGLSSHHQEPDAIRHPRDTEAAADAFRFSHDDDRPLAVSLVEEKGASSWLTCHPILRYGFALSKVEFRDGLCLRYGCTPSRLPSTCLCEKPLTVAHALSCPFGGFTSIRHNEVRDILASSLMWHTMCWSSPTFSQSPVSDSTCDPPRPRIKLAWTWLPAGFGEVDLSALFLM